MIKKTITFPDLDGNLVTEDFYFHLTKAEIVRMELGVRGGLSEKLQALIDAKNGGEIVANFEEIILSAYGERSADLRRFIKTPQLREEFKQTEAYSQLFMELVGNVEASSEFILGIVPGDLAEAVKEKNAVNSNVFDAPKDKDAFPLPDPRPAVPYTASELMHMSPEQFRAAQEQMRG